nr:unnamed protein product [Callosobruchus chinensis]
MKIVTKSIKDMVPKMITYMILSNTKRFIFDELLVHVYANEDQMELLEESPEAVKRREEKMAMYKACKSALDIIGDCSLQIATKTTVVEEERIYEKVQQHEPSRPSAAVKKKYAEFLHCKGKKFVDFNEVRQEIEAEQTESLEQ